MNSSLRILAVALSMAPITSFGQAHALKLKSGNYIPQTSAVSEVKAQKGEVINGRYYRFIQFNRLPSEEQKAELRGLGIELYNYIPHNTYMASIPSGISMEKVKTDNIIAVFPIEPQHKLDQHLATATYPDWAKTTKTNIEVVVTHHPNINHAQVRELLQNSGFDIVNSLEQIDAFKIDVDTNKVLQLAALPYLYFVELTDGEPTPENQVGRSNHRSNFLAPDYGNGLKYNGSGIHVALNDDGVIGPHIDYEGRIVQQYITYNAGDHGDHCAGTLFGGGNLNPTTRGMAWGADLGVYGVGGSFSTSYQAFDSIINHYNNKDVRITSTSYSNGNNAGYTTLARLMDVQTNDMPELLHVFSAGNSGTSNFGYGAGAGWGNITGGHKQAKNVIATGNLTSTDGLASSSSRGPARDGRIKPDICAVGSSVYSTTDPNDYTTKSGTSMACPAIAGVTAQLYQVYKETHNGAYPQSALVKGIMLNTADDLGNPGPDYKYGWGRINARRAYKVLTNNQYILDTVANGASDNHVITVPSNIAELRVMVYWHDYQATANAAPALVNDLNMIVTGPSSQVTQPWVLNPAPNATTLDQNAIRGIDGLNNVEQVTISSPSAGSYTVSVNGNQVPQGPQPYYIIYEMLTTQPVLTYPSGGETFVPNGQETIRWDAYGNTTNFTLEYSLNNGTSWTTIANNIPSSQRYFNWTPVAASGQALMRISRGSESDISDATFTIMGVPTGLNVDWVCIDSMQVSYSTVTGATGYIVSVLGNKYMDSAGFSTTGTCVVKNIDTRSGGWFTVQSIPPNGGKSRMANAVTFPAAVVNCTAPQDVALTGFISPNTSGVSTCNQININEPVSIVLKNYNFTNINNITLRYTVNNGTVNTAVYPGPLGVGWSDTITFSQNFTATTVGTYNIKAWLELSSGINSFIATDTITMVKNVTTSAPKPMPYFEDFETMILCNTTADCGNTACLLGNDLVNETGNVDDIDWRINSGPTPDRATTGQTGPNQDLAPGNVTGKYAYLEATLCSGKKANMVTPCIDMTNALNGIITFGYHMFGNNTGELHVDIFDGTTWTNDVTFPISGDQGNSWRNKQINISNYIGKIINVRFRGITGNGDNSDIAIDGIAVYQFGGISSNHSDNINCTVTPNPSRGVFNISLNNMTGINFTVTDVSGKIIHRQQVIANNRISETQIDLSSAPAGVYFLTVDNKVTRSNYKLVKL